MEATVQQFPPTEQQPPAGDAGAAAGAGAGPSGSQPTGQHVVLPPVVTPAAAHEHSVAAEVRAQLPALFNEQAPAFARTVLQLLQPHLPQPMTPAAVAEAVKQAQDASHATLQAQLHTITTQQQQILDKVAGTDTRINTVVGVLRETGSKKMAFALARSGVAGRFSEDGGAAGGPSNQGGSSSPEPTAPVPPEHDVPMAGGEGDGGAGIAQQQQQQQQQQPTAGAAGASAPAGPTGLAAGAPPGASPTGGAAGTSCNAGPTGGASGQARGTSPTGGAAGASRGAAPTGGAAGAASAEDISLDDLERGLEASRTSFFTHAVEEWLAAEGKIFVANPHMLRGVLRAHLNQLARDENLELVTKEELDGYLELYDLPTAQTYAATLAGPSGSGPRGAGPNGQAAGGNQDEEDKKESLCYHCGHPLGNQKPAEHLKKCEVFLRKQAAGLTGKGKRQKKN